MFGWTRPQATGVPVDAAPHGHHASRLQTGAKSIWMSKFAFAHNKKIEEGMSEVESFAQFGREVCMLPPGRASHDKTKILMPIEQFVISLSLEEKAQEEVTSYGTKDRASVRECSNVTCVCEWTVLNTLRSVAIVLFGEDNESRLLRYSEPPRHDGYRPSLIGV